MSLSFVKCVLHILSISKICNKHTHDVPRELVIKQVPAHYCPQPLSPYAACSAALSCCVSSFCSVLITSASGPCIQTSAGTFDTGHVHLLSLQTSLPQIGRGAMFLSQPRALPGPGHCSHHCTWKSLTNLKIVTHMSYHSRSRSFQRYVLQPLEFLRLCCTLLF